MLKCNIGASWRNDLRTGGASWNILDSQDFSENKIANEISRSVTRYLRIQSYVAHGGPSWLLSSIASEAVSNAVM
ncbi:hypothetical protein YC2023_015969 [Brassica napus]